MKSFTVFPNNIKNVPTDRFLGRDTTGTGQCELLDAAALREIASLYSMAEVDSLIAAIPSTAPGGSSGELQYNNGGAFGGASGLTWNSSRLQLGGTTSSYPALKRSTTAVHVRLADDSAFTDLRAKELRAYETAGVKYASLTHGGTDALLSASSGALNLSSSGTGLTNIQYFGSNRVQVANTSVSLMDGTNYLVFFDQNTKTVGLASGYVQKWSSSATNGTSGFDTAIARRSAGAIESNNGTAGTLRDVYARTFYGVAQAATDAAVCAQAHASQGSTSPVLKVINSAGSQLVGVLPDALQLGPAVTMKLSFDDPTNVSGANYIQSSYNTFRFRTYGGGGGDWGGNTLSLGSINDDATITNSLRGYGLKLVAIDGYGNANTAGTHITYCAGRGTGNATPGKHKFQTSTRVASGTTFQTLSTGIEICNEGIGVYNREVKFYGPGGQSAHGSSMGTYVPHYSDAAVFTLCNGVMENLGPGGTNNSLYRNDIMGTMHFVNRQNVGALGTATLALGPGYFSPSGYLGDYTTPLSGTPGNGALVASSGKGTNIAGSNLKLAGGRPTGTGTPGTVDICTAPSVASGTTLGTYDVVGRFDASITATHTRFLLWDVDAGALKRVYVGAADSGGTGKKVLCVDN